MANHIETITNELQNGSQWFKRKTALDASLLLVLNFAMFIIFTQLDVGEIIISKIQEFEAFELDEIIPLFITIALSLLFYTVRRLIELKKLFEEIEQISIRDHLTGLYNRRSMEDKFCDIVKCAQKESHKFSVIIVDIDDFKKINDNFGHNIGDIVLAQFSEIILSSTRTLDIVSRWGGEEFLILCPQTNLESASSAAKRILSAVRIFDFNSVGHVTASLGVVVTSEDESFESIVNRADKCLYKAKNSGKNCFVCG